jgi:hypothetical protein
VTDHLFLFGLQDIHLAAHKQILVFADADIEVQADQQTISQVTEFVNGGGSIIIIISFLYSLAGHSLLLPYPSTRRNTGTLLSFSSGVFLLDQIFPGRLKPRKGHTQSDKPIEIEITPSLSDASLFDKYGRLVIARAPIFFCWILTGRSVWQIRPRDEQI